MIIPTKDANRRVTVADLIAALQTLPQELSVTHASRGGCTDRVEVITVISDDADYGPCVVLI